MGTATIPSARAAPDPGQPDPGQTVQSDRATAISELSQRYRVPLRRFFEKRLGAAAACDVDDLVQEVFLRLSGSAALQPGQRLEGYIFQTAMNLLRDRQRRMAARAVQSHESYEEGVHGGAASTLNPERILRGTQLFEQLIAALYEMPERSRAVFALYHFENLSHAEISRRLGIAVSTIEKHMGRVNAYLLKRIDRTA